MNHPYFIQRHESGFMGNLPMWWREGGAGYTPYLDDAQEFTRAEAVKIAGAEPGQRGDKYTAWPAILIRGRARPAFDWNDIGDVKDVMGWSER